VNAPDRREAGGTVADEAVRQVALRLETPPEVASLGVGLHGIRRRHDVFQLPELWQLHLYRYHARLVVDGAEYAIRPGRVSVIPPGARVEYLYQGRSEHLYAHLRLPTSGPAHAVPLIQDAGSGTPLLSDLLEHGVSAFAASPAYAASHVWAVLWKLTRAGAGDRTHPALAEAVAYIEAHLSDALPIPRIARAAGISHNQLIRLFRAQTGDTVVGYVRRRRMERARHLLRETTMPISTIASTVGIPDLQALNKACRRTFGMSPRALRESSDGTGSTV
jgi:AraC family transcriptional regulator